MRPDSLWTIEMDNSFLFVANSKTNATSPEKVSIYFYNQKTKAINKARYLFSFLLFLPILILCQECNNNNNKTLAVFFSYILLLFSIKIEFSFLYFFHITNEQEEASKKKKEEKIMKNNKNRNPLIML